MIPNAKVLPELNPTRRSLGKTGSKPKFCTDNKGV